MKSAEELYALQRTMAEGAGTDARVSELQDSYGRTGRLRGRDLSVRLTWLDEDIRRRSARVSVSPGTFAKLSASPNASSVRIRYLKDVPSSNPIIVDDTDRQTTSKRTLRILFNVGAVLFVLGAFGFYKAWRGPAIHRQGRL